jgi:hypothetical protein
MYLLMSAFHTPAWLKPIPQCEISFCFQSMGEARAMVQRIGAIAGARMRERSRSELTGGCACRAIRYEISGEPMVMNTASAATVSKGVAPGTGPIDLSDKGSVKLEAKRSTRIFADSGNVKTHAFCSLRVTGLFDVAAMPDLFTVHASRRSPDRRKW